LERCDVLASAIFEMNSCLKLHYIEIWSPLRNLLESR